GRHRSIRPESCSADASRNRCRVCRGFRYKGPDWVLPPATAPAVALAARFLALAEELAVARRRSGGSGGGAAGIVAGPARAGGMPRTLRSATLRGPGGAPGSFVEDARVPHSSFTRSGGQPCPIPSSIPPPWT